jgi:alpha-aminoadipic semialdehyde synthase
MHAERQRLSRLQQQESGAHCSLLVQGHLFDTNLINQILDLVEGNKLGFGVKECVVRPNKDPRISARSSMVLEIFGETVDDITDIVSKLRTLITLIPKAEATIDDISGADDDHSPQLLELEKEIKATSINL